MALLRLGFATFFATAALTELGSLELFAQAYRADALGLLAGLRAALAPAAWKRLAAVDAREAVRYSALSELSLVALLLVSPGPAPLLAALRVLKMLLVFRADGAAGWESALAMEALLAAGFALPRFGRARPRRGPNPPVIRK